MCVMQTGIPADCQHASLPGSHCRITSTNRRPQMPRVSSLRFAQAVWSVQSIWNHWKYPQHVFKWQMAFLCQTLSVPGRPLTHPQPWRGRGSIALSSSLGFAIFFSSPMPVSSHRIYKRRKVSLFWKYSKTFQNFLSVLPSNRSSDFSPHFSWVAPFSWCLSLSATNWPYSLGPLDRFLCLSFLLWGE